MSEVEIFGGNAGAERQLVLACVRARIRNDILAVAAVEEVSVRPAPSIECVVARAPAELVSS